MALPRSPVQGATGLPSIYVGHIARFLKVSPTSVPLFISPLRSCYMKSLVAEKKEKTPPKLVDDCGNKWTFLLI
ncbi:hypothetical protein QL285_089033 [Trifolium repens]|nr:hypothetical protein QL285_089033 [Trifolium repens]